MRMRKATVLPIIPESSEGSLAEMLGAVVVTAVVVSTIVAAVAVVVVAAAAVTAVEVEVDAETCCA